MNLQRALELSAILQAAVGLTALIGTGKLPVVLMVIGWISVTMCLARCFTFGTEWIIFRLSRPIWNTIMVAALIASAIDLMWGSQDLLHACLFVVILLMAYKLLTLQRHTDFLHLYVLSFLEFLAAAVLTMDLWYAFLFVLYLLSAIWALLLWHLTQESAHAEAEAGPVSERIALTSQFFWTTNLIAMGALGLTLMIFFITPRTGFGFFQKAGGPPIRTTGFSEKVDLGGIGAVKQDSSLVMRVQFPDMDGPLADYYFRGAAFDRYNGRSWTNTLARHRFIVRNEDGILALSNERTHAKKATHVRQQILIEALDTSVLFGIPSVNDLKGEFLAVQTDGMDGLSLPVPMTARFQYIVNSTLPQITDEERLAGSFLYPTSIKTHFLQLPQLNPQIADLALSITRHAKTPYEQIMSVQRHLLTNYRYSLDVGPDDGMSPLEDFLFTRKTGYCEHYATAMVVMLRTLGIPARLVTGFLPGEWNEFGNYYRIRQQDSHAWVEAYFPHGGWMAFDPTPAISVGSGSADLIWQKLGGLIDSARLKWDRFVIQYSFGDQLAVVQAVRDRGESLGSRASSFLETLYGQATRWKMRMTSIGSSFRNAVVVTLVLGLVFFMVLGMTIYTHRRSAGRSEVQEQAIVAMYKQMLQILSSHGLTKAQECTPLEFSKQISDVWEEAGSIISPLTELYCRIRYGKKPFLDHDFRQAKDLLNQLHTVIALHEERPL